ncbi:L-aspartate oxidase [Desulfonispora thiosulfatigenes DSM 11270]|uniref:L-aspartate oxidase n=1 Tax=Desulfonispora thiosulfatigenes DSM 11270 TaxID=656914 RepID=A0A1W1VGA3_DESTI|nr:L-aspartate oxidase [Desulfonispora thiosulfatigenes]SMB92385.1 L-aspartate oxidase [Desulfonispora thiosulfatigenes DSM 11270]
MDRLEKIPRFLYSPKVFMEEETNIIIVGGGIAGLTTALNCSSDKKVLLVMECDFNDCNTYHAQGGIAAALTEIDSPTNHFNDTNKAGGYFCNEDSLKILTSEAPQAINFLIKNGVNFDKDQQGFCLAREGGHGLRRILRIDGDSTGRGLIDALKQKVLECKNIKVVQNSFMVDILTKDNYVQGIILENNKKMHVVYSNVVILASGGLGSIYSHNTNPEHITGDGIAAAFRAGALLSDMEFVQFHPTALKHPKAPRLLISEAVRGEGAILRNPGGERFMPKYHEEAELTSRDIVARAIFAEMSRLNIDNVFLDITHKSKEFLQKRFPKIYNFCLDYDIDMSKDWIPVVPAVHYTIGGIKTNLDGETNINGLYAVGEVACTGVHGANRLASNSLLEGVIFGKRVGESASQYCNKKNFIKSNYRTIIPKQVMNNNVKLFDESFLNTQLLVLKQMNQKYLGLIRTEEGLLKLLDLLTVNPLIYKYGFTNKKIWKFQNMLLVSYLSAYSSLKRKESRGVHYRSDYPLISNEKVHYDLQRRGIKEVKIC